MRVCVCVCVCVLRTYTNAAEIRDEINYTSIHQPVTAHDVVHTRRIRVPPDTDYESQDLDIREVITEHDDDDDERPAHEHA